MFVEHKEALEVNEAPARTMKLSEAIRIGKRIVGAEKEDFCLCAVGCAFAGINGRIMTHEERSHYYDLAGRKPCGEDINVAFARELGHYLGLNPTLLEKVHLMHYIDHLPALQIADWLEAQGY